MLIPHTVDRVSHSVPILLDAARLLFEMQRSHRIAQSFSGLVDPEAIAQRVTDGIIEQFDCAFARIWLVESDRAALRLVASSGLYTRTNGSFARVPMGAFKVGKIAQNCVPFLSNQLAEEAWVKDREWAIANGIQGFAGYPLMSDGVAIGVLAIFSQRPLAAEFLEVLQGLCATVTVALQTTLHYQTEKRAWQVQRRENLALSDRLAALLSPTRLTMVGTERSLGTSHTYLCLSAAEILNRFDCTYCRLTYDPDGVMMEAIVGCSQELPTAAVAVEAAFQPLLVATHAQGGILQCQTSRERAVLQVFLKLPNEVACSDIPIWIQCRYPVFQLAFTQLAYLAGLNVTASPNPNQLAIADSADGLQEGDRLLWIQHRPAPIPASARACLDLSISPVQLRQAVEVVLRGGTWGINESVSDIEISDREREIMSLLARGMRDRDLAQHLHISESTVKFHVKKVSAKLQARTRYEALYQLTIRGLL
ncbi:MAG: GAF domain-containing protein [Cyanobacteria bacterium J06639_1]